MQQSNSVPCRYHRRNPGRWHCRTCELELCVDCKPMADRLPDDVPCPLCQSAMVDLDAGPPFWRRWQSLLRHPAEPTAGAFVGALALVTLLLPGGLVGALLGLPLLAAFLYYAFVVFFTSACGQEEAPGIAQLLDRKHGNAQMDFLKIGLVYAIAIFAAWFIGSIPALAVVLLMASMAWPASVMAAAADEQFSAAFDYRRLTAIANRLGMTYNLLAASTLAVVAVPALLLYLPGLILPAFVHAALLVAAYGYLGLALARTIGSVLHQHRRELAFAGDVDPIDRPLPPKPAVHEPIQALADARVQIAEERTEQARRTIGEALTHYPGNNELNRRFEALLKGSGQINELKNHVERVLSRKVARGDAADAVDHWLQHRETLGDWLPRISATRHHMAMELEKRGDHRTAVRLLLSLPKNDPRYPKLPEACLEAARMLEQHFDDTQGAEPLRKFVVKRFPARAATWFEQQQELAAQAN
jgi:hypothetical protein